MWVAERGKGKEGGIKEKKAGGGVGQKKGSGVRGEGRSAVQEKRVGRVGEKVKILGTL